MRKPEPENRIPNIRYAGRVGLWRMLRFVRDPLGAIADAARLYGDLFLADGPLGPVVQCSHPEAAREVFTADPDTFDILGPEYAAPFLGENSLLLQAGPRHRADRKLLMPPFHGARMRAYGDIIREVALRHTAGWSPGMRVSSGETAQAISLEVVARAIFGVTGAARLEQVCDASREYIEALDPLLIFFPGLRRDPFGLGLGPWARHRRSLGRLDALLQEEMDARAGAPAGEDILSLLLQARYDDGSAMDPTEVRDQLLTLLFAGHETTAITLSWVLYWLHRRPAARARVLDELGPLGEHPAPEAVAALPYLDAVCQETLRLHPVVPQVLRKLRRPLSIQGHEVPAGFGVTIDVARVHQRADLYPGPAEWRPERFLERSYSPFEFMPFGGGGRRCIGAAFAVYEMKIVLAAVLQRHELRLADDRPLRTVRRNFTLGPENGVPMVVLRTLPAAPGTGMDRAA